MPIGFSGLLVIAAIILRRRWIAIVGVVTLYIFSTQFMSTLMLLPLEQVYKPRSPVSAPNADAIVVLNGGVVRGVNATGVQWGEAANRYFAGVALAAAGKARMIVLSSGPFPAQGRILRQVAVHQGIQPDHIVLTRRVLTTEDEARAAAEIPSVHSILLVTSAFHMPRAVMLFRARGLNVLPFPTDERVAVRQPLTLLDFIPAAASLETSETAMREYYGLVVYKIVLGVRSAI